MRTFWGLFCSLSAAGLLVAGEARATVSCTATFALDDAVALGALQLRADYPASDAAFDGSGTAVACTPIVSAIPNFNDDDDGTLNMGFVSLGDGFSGPHDLASCSLTTTAGLDDSDLTVIVVDAISPTLEEVSAPAVSARVLCEGDTTTTMPTTTTTLPLNTECVITVSLEDAVTVGSLQTLLHYDDSAGDFSGSGSKVGCKTVAPGMAGSYFENETANTVAAAVIALSGLAGPSPLYTCTYLPAAALPEASDFTIDIIDAGDINVIPIEPPPAINITSIVCIDPTATTTTTTTTTTTLAVCGNSTVEGSEECDDGNLVSGDGCSAACAIDLLCGDADANQLISAGDANRILRAAVGLAVACPLGVCDTTGDGKLTAGDAQRVLRKAVGLLVDMLCP